MSIMKPTRKLLFLLCPMLVLGFIYYSSGKLHLHVWGQKPDKSSPQINHPTVAMTVRTARARGRDKTKEPAAPPKKAKEPVVETLNTVGQVVGPAYDKQGFLLTLDGKLSQELIYKYGNLSEGACKPGYVAAKMTAIYPNLVCSTSGPVVTFLGCSCVSILKPLLHAGSFLLKMNGSFGLDRPAQA